MRASFFWRLYLGCVALILFSTVLLGLWFERTARADMSRDLDESLRGRLVLLEELAAAHWDAPLDPRFEARVRALGAESGVRLTIVRADGTVLADSERDPAAMENHAQRPEIEAARIAGEGSAQRDSDTVGRPYLYWARAAMRAGERVGFVRAAFPLDGIEARVSQLRRSTLWTALLAAAIALAFALYFARRVSRPLAATAELAERIARGDYTGVRPVEGADEIRRLSEAIRSMHEQLEERLSTITADRNKVLAILSGMVEGVIAVDREERIVHINSVAARLLDIAPERATGRRIWEVTRVTAVSSILEHVRKSGREQTDECKIAATDAARAEVEIELRASPLRDAGGADAGAVVVLHDVTSLRRLESVRRDFVANVSHELKTPLTAIRGLVETMLDDPEMPVETGRRFLERIREQSLRLSTLVGDLLTLARIEANEERVERRALDLGALLRDCSSRFGELAARHGLALDTQLGALSRSVEGDEESLRQIVDNLLDNACKYTPAGGRVWLRVEQDDSETRIEVRDTGIGIAPRDQERVFERFYRVDKARSRELGGTGLGLSIVKHLVQTLGGRVSLESHVGRGSTFRVHLPHASRLGAPSARG